MSILDRTALAASFADNSTGNITPGNIRDFVDSSVIQGDATIGAHTYESNVLGAADVDNRIVLDGAGLVIHSTRISQFDALNVGWTANGGGGDSILYFDSTNSSGFGINYYFYSQSLGGGSFILQGSADITDPTGAYVGVGGYTGSVTLAWDATTKWQLNTSSWNDGGSGLSDPVNFTVTTEAYVLSQDGYSGNAATSDSTYTMAATGGLGAELSFYGGQDLIMKISGTENWRVSKTSDGGIFQGACAILGSPVSYQLKIVSSDLSWIYHDGGGDHLKAKIDSGGKAFFVNLNLSGLPTSSAGLSSGDVWNSSGTLKIV